MRGAPWLDTTSVGVGSEPLRPLSHAPLPPDPFCALQVSGTGVAKGSAALSLFEINTRPGNTFVHTPRVLLDSTRGRFTGHFVAIILHIINNFEVSSLKSSVHFFCGLTRKCALLSVRLLVERQCLSPILRPTATRSFPFCSEEGLAVSYLIIPTVFVLASLERLADTYGLLIRCNDSVSSASWRTK